MLVLIYHFLGNLGVGVRTKCVELRTGTSDWTFLKKKKKKGKKFRVPYSATTSWLTAKLLTSQAGRFSVKLELVLLFIRNGILYNLGLDNTKYSRGLL